MKNLCLDIGNVIFEVDIRPVLSKISEVANATMEDTERFLRRFHQIHDLGFTTIEEEVKDHFGIRSPVVLSQIITLWNNSIRPHIDIITRIGNLRKAYGFQVALLSNIGVEHSELVGKLLTDDPTTRNFYNTAIKHFSCEVGARKPSKLFYQSFLWQYPQFTGSLYVDDLEKNLEVSRQFGFQTLRMSLEQSDVESKILEIERLVLS